MTSCYWSFCTEHNIDVVSYSTVVLYIRDHEDLGFPSQKKIHPNKASQLHPGTLAVLARYSQAQKCLQYDPKGFQ